MNRDNDPFSGAGKRPGLSLVAGHAPRTRSRLGHAVLNIVTVEQRIRRIFGHAVEEIHDVLWFDQQHGRFSGIADQLKPYTQGPPDQPA